MYSNPSLTDIKVIELILIDYKFSIEEFNLVKKALQMYTPAIWVPIASEIFSPDIQSQRKQIIQKISKLFQEYTSDWAFSQDELYMVKAALNHFVVLPLPLFESINVIREAKREKNVIKEIITYLE